MKDASLAHIFGQNPFGCPWDIVYFTILYFRYFFFFFFFLITVDGGILNGHFAKIEIALHDRIVLT